MHKAATFLDPRFVQLTPFIPDYDRGLVGKEAMNFIREIADTIIPPEPIPEPIPDPPTEAIPSAPEPPQSSTSDLASSSNQEPNEKKQKTGNPFFDYMQGQGKPDDLPKDAPLKESIKVRITKEMKLFAKVPQIGMKEDPLKWWAENRGTFPLLAQVARRLLAIPASSAPAECRIFFPLPLKKTILKVRLFSKLARVCAKNRSNMKPELANALLMV
jgi:hypothetical protein